MILKILPFHKNFVKELRIRLYYLCIIFLRISRKSSVLLILAMLNLIRDSYLPFKCIRAMKFGVSINTRQYGALFVFAHRTNKTEFEFRNKQLNE